MGKKTKDLNKLDDKIKKLLTINKNHFKKMDQNRAFRNDNKKFFEIIKLKKKIRKLNIQNQINCLYCGTYHNYEKALVQAKTDYEYISNTEIESKYIPIFLSSGEKPQFLREALKTNIKSRYSKIES